MGMEWDYTAKPDEIKRVCEALDEFGLYIRTQHPELCEYGDPTSLSEYWLFDDPNNVDEYFAFWAKPKLAEGNHVLWWLDINWITRFPYDLFAKLKRACEEHGCMDFFNELVAMWETGDKLLDQIDMIVEQHFGKGKVEMAGERKW